MEEIIEFITKVRTIKLENKVPKDSVVAFKGENEDIILNMLKIKENNKDVNKNGIYYINPSKKYEISFTFDTSVNKEEEKENLLKEKEKLENSINRRKKLLSNENYVNKAPTNVVENDRNNLAKEEKELEIVLEKLNKY